MNNPFDQIKQETNITPDEIYDIAESVKHANFTDERTVRQLIQQLAKIANRPISKAKEEQMVEMILNNNLPTTIDELNNMF
ncbi:MAG TPA: stage VI sporulation protein F [Bacillota bacterium]|nr:stage VI sporulation protein F [Bacillota bacterium]